MLVLRKIDEFVTYQACVDWFWDDILPLEGGENQNGLSHSLLSMLDFPLQMIISCLFSYRTLRS